MNNKKVDKSYLAIGGTTLIGFGIGLFFVKTAPLIFLACLVIGIGAGLVLAPIISARQNSKKDD